MSSIIILVVQLLTGAAGGNLLGLVRSLSLGNTGNTIAGALGAVLFSFLPVDATGYELVNTIASGLVGGAGVTAVAGLVRNILRKV